jgi:hypothetical protein
MLLFDVGLEVTATALLLYLLFKLELFSLVGFTVGIVRIAASIDGNVNLFGPTICSGGVTKFPLDFVLP